MNVKPNDVRPNLFKYQRHHDGSDSDLDVDKDSTNDYRTNNKDEIDDICIFVNSKRIALKQIGN